MKNPKNIVLTEWSQTLYDVTYTKWNRQIYGEREKERTEFVSEVMKCFNIDCGDGCTTL